jgi:hypothetical protein
LSAVIDEAHLFSPVIRDELERILRGRRDRILRRYLLKLSSLTRPEVKEGRLCVEDRAEAAGLGAAPAPAAKLWLSAGSVAVLPVSRPGPRELCVEIPELGEEQRVVDLSTGRAGQFPLRVHLLGGDTPRVVGLDRPQDDHPPAG